MIDPQLWWATFKEGMGMDRGRQFRITPVMFCDRIYLVNGFSCRMQGIFSGFWWFCRCLYFEIRQYCKRLWVTWSGGTEVERGHSITTDSSGNLFVTGETWSRDFPVQNSGTFFKGSLGGGADAFILKFDKQPLLGNLLWRCWDKLWLFHCSRCHR